ncbi:MAG TPA: archaeosortase/exosortase family protein [Flavobacteriales bacterium]|nr:archaeosortase/exosortase family protein [Flavobacteriales bacterium]
MLNRFKHISPVYRFVFLFALLSICWYLLYNFLLKPYTGLDMAQVHITAATTQWMLETLGHTTFVKGRELWIAGTSGLWIGDNCNAIPLFALFSGFIISFPGNIKSKAWFIPLGIVLIFLFNCIRIALLAISELHSRAWTEFNHTYTFTIIIYGFIFLLWIYWVNRHSLLAKKKHVV